MLASHTSILLAENELLRAQGEESNAGYIRVINENNVLRRQVMSEIKCDKCGSDADIFDIENERHLCIKCSNKLRITAIDDGEIVNKEDVISNDTDDSVRIPVDSYWETTHGCSDIDELYKCTGNIASRVRTGDDDEEFLYPCGRYKKDGHGCFCPLCSAIQNLLDVVYKQENPKAYLKV